MEFDRPVLVPAHPAPALELVPMLATCAEPRVGGPLVRQLGTVAPLPDMPHAKRVRKYPQDPSRLELLLCAPPEADGGGEGGGGGGAGALPEALATFLSANSLETHIVQVPRVGPHSKEEAAEWSQHWPIGWNASEAAALQRNTELSPAEVGAMQRHMQRAFELARQQSGEGSLCNACVIADPATGRAVGEAADGRGSHPLLHAAMGAVAAVAEWQLRVWPDDEPGPGNAADGSPSDSSQAKRQRLEAAEGSMGADGSVQGGSGGAAKPQQAGDPGPRPYLCTGYDCFLVHEPCVMCAMALVHSRLRRVVFCRPDASHGALGGGRIRLHSQRSLNHHYQVYHLPAAGGGAADAVKPP